MSDANSRTVVLQDTHSLFGRGAATAVTFVQHQCDWLWAGDAKAVVLDVEVFDITAATTAPTLKVQTALTENGLWSDVGTYTAAGTALLGRVQAAAMAAVGRDHHGRGRRLHAHPLSPGRLTRRFPCAESRRSSSPPSE